MTAVPYTGRKSTGYWFRRPRHIGTIKRLLGAFGRLRGVTVPPSAWDDLTVWSVRDRSWKRFRNRQWKAK